MQLFCENQLLEVIEGIPNTCSFSWTVPGRESRSCQVTIVVGSGQMASSGNFIISRPPVLREIDIGGPGREPSSIREFVVFTSNRNGNEDLWIKNRRTGDLAQSTFFPGKDGEANLFKPNGNVFAFTSERTGRKEIWMMSIITREAKQVTKSGGSSPAWQPSFCHISNDSVQKNGSIKCIKNTYLRHPTPNSDNRYSPPTCDHTCFPRRSSQFR